MNKYLFIYKSPPATGQQPSPEETQQMFEAWNVWMTQFKKNIVSGGDGLKPGGKVLTDGKLSDAPFAEAKEIIGGYSIIQAESYDEAVVVARSCPMTHVPGSVIAIHEMAGYGM
jgi:hypothetical protein